jgi:SMI1 / KNR4 family (SUKH-1)
MYAERIPKILKKLAAARSAPGLGTRFGVEKHHFRLRPPLPKSELLAFERHHNVVLPEDYRQFLLLASDGGAGPYYGLEPLSNWDEWFEEEAQLPGFLASSCPLVDGVSLRDAWKAAQMRDARRAQGVVHVGATPSEAWEALLPRNWPEWGKGTINICDQGCTYSARLIVSGEARGRIVYLDSQLWYPPYFVSDPNFIDWYERWLENTLSAGQDGWFGFDNPAYSTYRELVMCTDTGGSATRTAD